MDLNVTIANLSHLITGAFKYQSKNITVDAIQVTRSNVGKLALEFDSELFWDEDRKIYFMNVVLARFEGEPAEYDLSEGGWIFDLRGELQVWDDDVFKFTFEPWSGQWAEPPSDATYKEVVSHGRSINATDMFITDMKMDEGQLLLHGSNDFKPSPVPRIDHADAIGQPAHALQNQKYLIGQTVYVAGTYDTHGTVTRFDADNENGPVYFVVSQNIPHGFWVPESEVFPPTAAGSHFLKIGESVPKNVAREKLGMTEEESPS